MLYLALPPAPPPIVMTVAPKSTVKTSNQKLIKPSTDAEETCFSLEVNSQKPSLVNSLFNKMLAASTPVSENPACKPQKASSVKEFPQVHQNRVKNNYGDSNSPSISHNSTGKQAATTPKIANNQPNATDSAVVSAIKSSKSQIIAANSQDTVTQILAAVQELINISIYASINNIIPVDTSTQSQSYESEPTKDINSQKVAIKSNPITTEKPEAQANAIASGENFDSAKILAIIQELVTISISASLNNIVGNALELETLNPDNNSQLSKPKQAENTQKIAATTSSTTKLDSNINQNPKNQSNPDNSIQLARNPDEPFLVAVVINGREVGTLDIIQQGNTLLIPIDSFSDLAGFEVKKTSKNLDIKTPLGSVQLSPDSLKQINGISYISSDEINSKLSIKVSLNTADLTLLTDLPWRSANGQYRQRQPNLKPEFFAPKNGLSSFRQELDISTTGGDSSLRSSSRLGGRIGGGSFQARIDNDFVNQPEISEYFFYKRFNSLRLQVGRQQVGLHPLISQIDLTGLQLGYSNLPAESFSSGYGANELLPRRSRPIQSFRGDAPPASFVQLRVSGVPVAQQQVGFDGKYEFVDVSLPIGQSNEVEVAIFDRNNLRVPITVRTVRINASDLLLPAGGNVQLGGIGFSGNLVQNTLFNQQFDSDYAGKFVGFYQMRQGLSNNLTFEGSVQATPGDLQSQAGLVLRLANPVILSGSVGTSGDKVGYTADLDVQLKNLQINANSQSLPRGYESTSGASQRYNHSLELKYNLNNNFNLGFIARNYKDSSRDSSYILPTFTARPFSSLSINGRPDIEGRYLVNAFYQPSAATRLSFNTYGDLYTSDLSYKFGNDYQLSLGNEFGGSLDSRYSFSIGRNPSRLDQLGWNIGLAYRGGEVAPIAGASMRVLPGLFARVEYQGIPSRTRGIFGGVGDDRFTVSLVSDLSFAGGRVTPASYGGISKERGAIAGRIQVAGGKKNFDLSGSNVRVIDSRNRMVGAARTDKGGNFFVGNLPEGVYFVELEPDELPIELSIAKTTRSVEVANSAVTKLDFPVRQEYGVAGKITDATGQPVAEVKIELLNGAGARVISNVTDKFGLYRLDGVPVGKYTLRISQTDQLNSNDTLPKRQVEVSDEFVYNQNLQLPISTAAKKK
ncbi:carboxypeptidase regulatory-like domain-containing protein [Calothrix sp. PCC 6303]|uniref:carboxypeptidase regulatory-like domain-containing protein n=1 Tax=Calothrix sp. PCC 6303 TaxID=1170562 RepID=UPI0002A05924|nr:carboxypeptidase regulatory-like domain-containing protein [Calothrix sp. PCC 6303]AFZ04009.1 Cna B domain protein [Calothrix sp. PCC 6303]